MKKTLIAATLASCGLAAQAQVSGDVIKVGFLTDMSSVYADIDGAGGVDAIKMAIADMKGMAAGKKIEFIFADHQNKADVASAKAREWIDTQGLDVLIGGTNSGANLAMATVAAEKKKPFISIGAGSSALTNANCTPYTIHYAYDTVALANGTGAAVTKAGGKTWFFLTADYAFGAALQADTAAVVAKSGGTVKGSVKHPLNASDFSSFLLQAQSSGAQILGLANAGGDAINAVKAANEFGIVEGGQKLAALLLFINDVHSLGLKTAHGLTFTESFYWDLNEGTRAFSKRFQEKATNKAMPSMTQAGNYAAILHYLKALDALGGNPHDGAKVVAKMKELPTDDPLFGKGPLREDGRRIIPAYLFEVKKPEESKGPWDYYKLVATIPAEDAAKPLKDSECPLVKK